MNIPLLGDNAGVSVVASLRGEITDEALVYVRLPNGSWKKVVLDSLRHTGSSIEEFCRILSITQSVFDRIVLLINTPGGDTDIADTLTAKDGLMTNAKTSMSLVADVAFSAGAHLACKAHSQYAPDDALYMFHDATDDRGRMRMGPTLRDDLQLIRNRARSASAAESLCEKFDRTIMKQDDDDRFDCPEVWSTGAEMREATVIGTDLTTPVEIDAQLCEWQMNDSLPEELQREIAQFRQCYALQRYIAAQTGGDMRLCVESVDWNGEDEPVVTHEVAQSSMGFRSAGNAIERALGDWEQWILR